MNDIFRWDGSDLTIPLKRFNIDKCTTDGKGKLKYWKIYQGDEKIYCEVRSCKNILPIIIDELKPIFGQTKMGTHWTTIGKKIYMLIRVGRLEGDGEIKRYKTLKDWDYDMRDRVFIQKVQEIFGFRQLLGITKSTDGSIKISYEDKNSFPVSCYEPNMYPEKTETSFLPATVLQKWFKDNPELLDMTIKKITKIHKVSDISERIFYIRNEINDTIERIDRDSITYTDFIITRILNHIQSCVTVKRKKINPYKKLCEMVGANIEKSMADNIKEVPGLKNSVEV